MLKREESGRSLTEMMGTLAIMGILAIAGIWMYNSAMDRLKANTLIQEAQKRAVVVAGQIGFQDRTDPSLGEFSENEFAGGTFSTNVITNGLYQQFGIQVSNVPKAICQNILNAIGDTTPIRRITYVGDPKTAITSCGENNTLLLVYNNDMSTSGGDTAYAADDCGCQTVCGQCVSEDGEQKCVNECPANQNTCSSNTDCSGTCVGCVIPDGETQGTCQACQRVAYLESPGSRYIDTGIPGGSGVLAFLKFRWMSGSVGNDQYLLASNTGSRSYFGTYQGKWQYGYGEYYQATGIQEGVDYVGEVSWLPGNQYVKIDGNIIIQKTIAREFETPNLVMFARNQGGGAVSFFSKSRIYYCRINKNGIPVRDFIPVHAPFKEANKQNCMYDKVSKGLFCNAGTGNDFIIP